MKENIIIFPGYEQKILNQTTKLMQNEHFVEAIEILENIIQHDKSSFKLNSRLLECYIHLNEAKSGIILVEELLQAHDEYFSHYFQFYLIMLTEVEQFAKINRKIKENRSKLKDIDPIVLKQYQTYAEEQTSIQIKAYDDRFLRLLQDQAFNDIYQLLNHWEKLELTPTDNFFKALKVENHPVIKTKILFILKAYYAKVDINIRKFNQNIQYTTGDLPSFSEKTYGLPAFKALQHLENDNPSLYQLAYQLLNQYLYVIYPINYNQEIWGTISKTIAKIAADNLNTSSKKESSKEIEDVKMILELYEQIIWND